MRPHPATVALVSLLSLLVLPSPLTAQVAGDAITPGALRTYSTFYAIGLEWDVVGDADHDAVAQVQFQVNGMSGWREALPLVRVDYNGANTVAGSILFLEPNVTYAVRVSLHDPDGGSAVRDVTVQTRRLPVPPAGGRVLHVVPGAGGGDGSAEAPFGGIAAAEAVAQAGDTFVLHAGDYGGRVRFAKAGTSTLFIAWRAAGDGEVAMHGIDVAASYLWLEGFTVRNQPYGLLSFGSPTGVVVTRCSFGNNRRAIFLQGAGTNWYIADNVIVGDRLPSSESLDGEGVDLNKTSGHTVAHNRISRVADGVSYPYVNVDIFGNDIFDTSDDGIEPDYGRANVRIWGNRIHNAAHNGITFQPQSGGPWYLVRNQIIGGKEAALKFRTTDRFVLLHNTIVHWGDAWTAEGVNSSMMCCNEQHLLRAFARNNLWVSIQGGQIWGFDAFTRDWRSDLDYDGFDWNSAANPFTYGGLTYPDIWSFAAASGLETHGIRIAKASCFSQLSVPGPSPASVPPQVLSLTPQCNAVDAGARLPGINDAFAGLAPDMGAHEYDAPLAVYGPRALSQQSPPPAPSGLTATMAYETAVTLRWTDNSGGLASFAIQRASGDLPFVTLNTVDPGITTFLDGDVLPGTRYTYRVRAYNGAGDSPYSNTAVVTTPIPREPWTSTTPHVPGLIQVEDFDRGDAGVVYVDTTAGNTGGAYRTTDVDIGAAVDTDGGYYVGWTRPDEWLAYTLAVMTTGTYTLEVRVASRGTGARFHLEVDGVDKTGPIAVPDTGGWQTWRTVSRAGVSLTEGVHDVRIVFETGTVENGGVGNWNWVRFVEAPTGSTPYGGTPRPLPGTVQAEDFDEGGEGVAYHDLTTLNSGGAYRSTGVDVQATSDTGGGYGVGWTRAGEWLKYTVSVATAGTYTFSARVACSGSCGTFHVEFGGVNKTGSIAVPNTGGWQTWTTLTRTVTLAAGTQVMRIAFDTNGTSGGVGNLNHVRVESASQPYRGVAAALPGTVQAENFDEGGESVAYHDTTAINSGGAYRSTGVDVEATRDTGGGHDVGWTRAGEWLKYTVTVASAGTYTLSARVACGSGCGTFHVEFGGVNKTGPIAVPHTGGWQTWTTLTRTVTLAAGTQVMRIAFDTNGTSGGVGNVNTVSISN